eukprot:PhM_4_TR2140/c2_g1_i3/m.13594
MVNHSSPVTLALPLPRNPSSVPPQPPPKYWKKKEGPLMPRADKARLVCRHWLTGRCTRPLCHFKHAIDGTDVLDLSGVQPPPAPLPLTVPLVGLLPPPYGHQGDAFNISPFLQSRSMSLSLTNENNNNNNNNNNNYHGGVMSTQAVTSAAAPVFAFTPLPIDMEQV